MQNLEALSILQPLRNESDPEKRFRLEDCRAKIIRKGLKVGVFLQGCHWGLGIYRNIHGKPARNQLVTNISES